MTLIKAECESCREWVPETELVIIGRDGMFICEVCYQGLHFTLIKALTHLLQSLVK